MRNADNTSYTLYCFLRLLNVRASRFNIDKLLSTPVGNTMRGVSDALDNMQIKNAVYQLPEAYFDKLEAPFIAAIHSKEMPFCVVSKLDKEGVSVIQQSGKEKRISRVAFLKTWTGAVLLAEKTEQTVDDRFYQISNLFYYIARYQCIVVGGLLLCFTLLLFADRKLTSLLLVYLLVLFGGMLVSALIIYKESINNAFMQRFCKVGDVIDCNHVLQSKGGQLFGFHLGELSMIYFSILFCFTMVRSEHAFILALSISVLGCIFTFYSLFYQAAILRKWCFLCIVDACIVWIATFILHHLNGTAYTSIRLIDLLYFSTIGALCLIAVNMTRQQILLKQHALRLQEKQSHLMNPELFSHLLLANQSAEIPPQNIVLSNGVDSNDYRIQIITNPNCGSCAKLHEQLMMNPDLPVDLIFITNTNDSVAKRVAGVVIDTYITSGWSQAMKDLSSWFEKKNKLNVTNKSTEQASKLLLEQQKFCEQINLKHTPFIGVNGHILPDIYELKDLRYLI